MSYAQRKQLSGNPVVAWTLTLLLVGGLLYAIVTGLAYNVIKKTAENLKVVDVEEQPPPPEEPPPPEKPPPPPLEYPPPPREPPELIRIFSATFRKNHRNPGETMSKVTSPMMAAIRSQLGKPVVG